MRLLYPCDEFDQKQPDPTYQDEYIAVQATGTACSLYSVEEAEVGLFKPRPNFFKDEQVIYRGWMLTQQGYCNLHQFVANKGGHLATSIEQYTHCHYLPNWYPLCKEFTPQTIFCNVDSDFKSILAGLHWDRYFVKDYVKSLTTNRGSVANHIDEIYEIIEGIKKFRGSIEGGVCIRQFEQLRPETEERYFVFQGKVFARDGIIPPLVEVVSARINSPFFSIDTVLNADGELRLIELGDGQVSDIKKWKASEFVKIFMD